jgi:hypothetical protein
MVIGGLGACYVFLAQMAFGGGVILCDFELLRRSGRSRHAGRFINGRFPALVLVGALLGALTGLAMWLISVQVGPRTTGALVDEFHWIWATAWTTFCLEIVSGLAFLRYKDRLSARGRLTLLVLYTTAAWFGLFWISGIFSFAPSPLPGRWAEPNRVWAGLFNASFWPSLLYRSVAAMSIAALAACVAIEVDGASDREARRELIGHASRFLAPMVLMPILGGWFLATSPPENRSAILGGSAIMTIFAGVGVVGSALIGAYALGALRYRSLSINGLAAALLCALAFAATAAGEFVLGGGQVVRSGSTSQGELDRSRTIGSVADDPYPLPEGMVDPDRQIRAGAGVFPFGFPWPTAMFLTLLIVTALIYTVFMQYVLAGAIVLVFGCMVSGIRKRVASRADGPRRSGLGLIESILRDWLPATLGLAITTGIAPLLFSQVLYRRQFDTATLLLHAQFMLLSPAMIVAFCLLYLLKSRAFAGRGAGLRASVTVLACGCLFYTSWMWTENHVLSLHPEVWRAHSAMNGWLYRNAEIWPRLGYWITSSFTVLAVAVAWQLRWGRRSHNADELDRASRRLRALALLGLATSVSEGWLWQLWLEPALRAPIVSLLALPYGFLALAGVGIQAAGWLPVKTAADFTAGRLGLVSAGAMLTILGALVMREARRLAAIDIAALYEAHSRAAHAGGMGVFLVSFALNAALVTACVLIVRRSLSRLR